MISAVKWMILIGDCIAISAQRYKPTHRGWLASSYMCLEINTRSWCFYSLFINERNTPIWSHRDCKCPQINGNSNFPLIHFRCALSYIILITVWSNWNTRLVSKKENTKWFQNASDPLLLNWKKEFSQYRNSQVLALGASVSDKARQCPS